MASGLRGEVLAPLIRNSACRCGAICAMGYYQPETWFSSPVARVRACRVCYHRVRPAPHRGTAAGCAGNTAIVNSVDICHKCGMRTPEPLTVRKLLAMTSEMADAINEFRFREMIKSEAEAIRVLIQRGLDATATDRKKASG